MDNLLIDGHKLYWHLDRVAAWQRGELIPPIYVEISPVSFCNHQCVFCGLDFAHGAHQSLDTELLCRRLAEMGRLGVRSIMLAGEGEPLLHKDLPMIVSAATGAGIDVAITSNGAAGNRPLWEELLPHLSWFRFSVDAGSPSVYARVHGVPEQQFHRTVENIREALQIRKEKGLAVTIGVQYLMIPENLADIERAILLCDEVGVDYLSLKPYSEHPQMINKSGFTYTEEMLGEVAEIVERHRSRVKFQLIYRHLAAAAYKEGALRFRNCCALPFWGYISAGGDFHTCSVFLNDPRFAVGNIYHETMDSVFFGERRRQSVDFARRELVIGAECRVNCRMARINEFLDILSEKPQHLNFI